MPVLAWEVKLDVDPRIKVIEKNFDGINVGAWPNFYVATKPERCIEGKVAVLAHFKGILLEEGATDLRLNLHPTDRSSFDPPRPGYQLCRMPHELRPYFACEECAVVNPREIKIKDKPNLKDMLTPAKGR